MLTRVERPVEPRSEIDGQIPDSVGTVDFDLILASARRQSRVFAIAAAAGLVFGVAYLATAVPQYTATTDLLIDSQKDKNDLSASIAALTFDTGAIDSQVEVLKSEKIASSVIAALKLTEDPEFMGSRGSLAGRAMALLRSAFDFTHWFVTRSVSDPEERFELERAAIAHLKANLDVRRVARTYVLAIDYTAPDPEKAATIANAFAEAYLTDQLDSKFEATRRASGWMQARIAQLKADSIASDSAVQKFKADRGLVTADGKLVSDQQMTELNTQLMLAHGDTARAEARFNQITQMLKAGQTDGAVTNSLGSPVVTELRQKYLAASKTEAELENKLGSRPYRGRQSAPRDVRISAAHLRGAAADRGNLPQRRRGRAGEGGIAQRVDVDAGQPERGNQPDDGSTARTRAGGRNLSDALSGVPAALSGDGPAAVVPDHRGAGDHLRDEARRAELPPALACARARSSVGSMAGVGVGVLREYRDRVFRVASQVRDELGLDFLGMLEGLELGRPAEEACGAEARDAKAADPEDSLQRYTIDHPLSRFFGNAAIKIKVTTDLALADRKPPRFIGVDFGAARTRANPPSSQEFRLAARPSRRPDAADRRRSAQPRPDPRRGPSHAQMGVLEAIRDDVALRDCLMLEPDSGLFVLPAVIRKRVSARARCSPRRACVGSSTKRASISTISSWICRRSARSSTSAPPPRCSTPSCSSSNGVGPPGAWFGRS